MRSDCLSGCQKPWRSPLCFQRSSLKHRSLRGNKPNGKVEAQSFSAAGSVRNYRIFINLQLFDRHSRSSVCNDGEHLLFLYFDENRWFVFWPFDRIIDKVLQTKQHRSIVLYLMLRFYTILREIYILSIEVVQFWQQFIHRLAFVRDEDLGFFFLLTAPLLQRHVVDN